MQPNEPHSRNRSFSSGAGKAVGDYRDANLDHNVRPVGREPSPSPLAATPRHATQRPMQQRRCIGVSQDAPPTIRTRPESPSEQRRRASPGIAVHPRSREFKSPILVAEPSAGDGSLRPCGGSSPRKSPREAPADAGQRVFGDHGDDGDRRQLDNHIPPLARGGTAIVGTRPK